MNHNPSADFSERFGTVLIVEDHPLYAEAIREAVSLQCGGVARVCDSVAAAVGCIEAGLDPDLILLDLRLPDSRGLEGFGRLRAAVPEAAILVVSAVASQKTIDALLAAGAAGFMAKEDSADTLRRAIAEIARGRMFTSSPRPERSRADAEEAGRLDAKERLAALTPQQTRIMAMICDGKPNKQIAYEMSLAEASVKAHITALLRRLGVQNRTQAALLARSASDWSEDRAAP